MAYDFRSDPVLGRAYEYWQSKCNGRLMPQRRDIDPREITRILPYVQINEFVDGGARIRYRLVGTAIAATHGIDYTGKYLDEVLAADLLRHFEKCYRLMCRERKPVLMSNRYLSRKDVDLISHRVALPLSEDEVTVNQALIAMSFQFPADSNLADPKPMVDSTASCEIIQ